MDKTKKTRSFIGQNDQSRLVTILNDIYVFVAPTFLVKFRSCNREFKMCGKVVPKVHFFD